MNFVYYYYTRGFGVQCFLSSRNENIDRSKIQPIVQTALRRKIQDLHLCSQKKKKKKRIEMQVRPFNDAVLALCGALIEKVKHNTG